MPWMERFHERIGTVILPEADTISDSDPQATPSPDASPGDVTAGLDAPASSGLSQFKDPYPRFRFCFTSLRQGCYTIGFTPAGTRIWGTRYRGTMRVEHTATGVRISGDLYRYSLLDILIFRPPLFQVLGDMSEARLLSDEAADTGGAIPIYKRRDYATYLKGTGAQLISITARDSTTCPFTLEFDQFDYNQPATGFAGNFNPTATRKIRWELSNTSTPDFYTGSAFDGATNLGSVSMRWVADSFRRAQVVVNTLTGATTPPADVGGTTMASIFDDAGWDVTVTDGGGISLPAALSGVTTTACWSTANLHTLMSSVPGYDPTTLDSAWTVHLVAVPAMLGCSRGIMFDSSSGSDPNGVPREGSATFSNDGYPAAEVPDGMGGSHYDAAAGGMQKDFPRAFLRSATHEVGHAFNQIHQGFEAGDDNSIMTPTPSVATVLGLAGTFPGGVNLAFNTTVKKHLRHLPDPAVRPGAMDFFGSAVSAPQPADVAWLELQLAVKPSSNRVALGEPITLSWELTNTADAEVPVPAALDVESLYVRVNVTDPTGEITFMRPPNIESCPTSKMELLAPGDSRGSSTALFWGLDGFAFERPGRHRIEAIALWRLGGAPVAVSGDAWVFVSYPTSGSDNEVAALMLHPEVGKAVALGDAAPFELAGERIARAVATDENHPAASALRDMGLVEKRE